MSTKANGILLLCGGAPFAATLGTVAANGGDGLVGSVDDGDGVTGEALDDGCVVCVLEDMSGADGCVVVVLGDGPACDASSRFAGGARAMCISFSISPTIIL